VFSTGRGRLGLDLMLADRDCDGYLAAAGADWKKRHGPPQATSLARLWEPVIPEARRLHRAVQRAVARGDVNLRPHPYRTCVCFFSFGGGSHRDKVRTTRAIKRAVTHCLPQTVGLGFLSATAAARPVDAAGAVTASDEQITRVDPNIGGVMLPVDRLAGGLRGFYRSVDELTFASRWNAGAVQADLLHAWARSAAAQRRRLPAASRARLILAVARLWMDSDWSVCTWSPELKLLVPPVLRHLAVPARLCLSNFRHRGSRQTGRPSRELRLFPFEPVGDARARGRVAADDGWHRRELSPAVPDPVFTRSGAPPLVVTEVVAGRCDRHGRRRVGSVTG
jgi:hypothetical protein